MSLFDFLKRPKRNKEEQLTESSHTRPFDIKMVLPDPPHYENEETDPYIPQSKSELSEVTQSIWTYAPDEYDNMYWPTPHRPTLASDFEELRQGINFVFRQKRFNESRAQLLRLVEDSYSAYLSGDRQRGMELITEVQIMYGKMK